MLKINIEFKIERNSKSLKKRKAIERAEYLEKEATLAGLKLELDEIVYRFNRALSAGGANLAIEFQSRGKQVDKEIALLTETFERENLTKLIYERTEVDSLKKVLDNVVNAFNNPLTSGDTSRVIQLQHRGIELNMAIKSYD